MNIKKGFIIISSLLLIFIVFALTMPKAIHAEVLGIWLFDEGKGKTVKDASGNGHDGEIIGAVEWAAGKFESALKFDNALSEKEIKEVMEGLAKMFQTVNPNGKLAATWAKIKAE
jgi:hypothetical protein